MIARLSRWIRRRAGATPYDASRDPVVIPLREIRRESLAATRQSQAAVRKLERNPRDLSDMMRVPPAWHRQPPEGRESRD